MAPTTIPSDDDFRQAVLRSEGVRTLGLLFVFGVLLAIVVARVLLGPREEYYLLPRFVALLVAASAYEGLMLALARRAIRRGSDLPRWLWALSAVVESLTPTAVILLLSESSLIWPYPALAVPAAHTYYLFIILSTLRLRPSFCLLTGLASALGFAALTAYTLLPSYPGGEVPDGRAYRLQVYVAYSLILVFAGAIAAGVAAQMRRHVLAALGEAETRYQLQRIEDDLRLARSIQQGLLPKHPPRLAGFDVAGWSRLADHTGGDYYDWQALPDGRVVLSLADVNGHGIGPALVAAACRAYARASLSAAGDLGVLLGRLDALLAADLPADRFVTFVACRLDPATARVQVLSAGHGPLFLYRAAEDRVVELGTHHPPLNLAPGLSFDPPDEVELAPGDLLVLVTDGFFEWPDAAGERFGIPLLREAIRSGHALSPDRLIAHLYDRVVEFSGGTRQEDDLTAVVLKRKSG
jgi:serine phosphatase RsbU (regulator of sigma subunit)